MNDLQLCLMILLYKVNPAKNSRTMRGSLSSLLVTNTRTSFFLLLYLYISLPAIYKHFHVQGTIDVVIRQGIHRHHLASSSFSSGLSQNHQLNRTCTNASPEPTSRNAWNSMLSQGNSPTGRISAFTSRDTANMAHFGGQTGVVNSELCTRTIRGTVQLSSGLCYVERLTSYSYT